MADLDGSICCSYPKCVNSEGTGFRMFKFPKNDARNRIWSEFVGQNPGNFHSYHSKYLCAAHFEPSCMLLDPFCRVSNPTIYRNTKLPTEKTQKEPVYTLFLPIRGNPFAPVTLEPVERPSTPIDEHRCSNKCIKHEDPIMDHSYSINPKKYIKQMSNLQISIPDKRVQPEEETDSENLDLDCNDYDFNGLESDSDQSEYFDYSKLPPESESLLQRIDILEEKNELLKLKNTTLTRRLRKLELENLQLREEKENVHTLLLGPFKAPPVPVPDNNQVDSISKPGDSLLRKALTSALIS